ncbi:hypothetical protein H5410_055771 [Solanum commersonii]|uniref:Uncharacterized protein n=1 Tax=Solanum commersonii TaxID=4109 RepID=A0A9J5WJP3_SOLCO|nr:hypothetical protein H5410_055771 [Solanum commersonii]
MGYKLQEHKAVLHAIMHRVTYNHPPLMLQCEDFSERIKNWWKSFYCTGRSDYILTFKLKTLKKKLKEWSNLRSEDEITKRLALSMKFEDIARHEEIAWRRRSRTLWLKQEQPMHIGESRH